MIRRQNGFKKIHFFHDKIIIRRSHHSKKSAPTAHRNINCNDQCDFNSRNINLMEVLPHTYLLICVD